MSNKLKTLLVGVFASLALAAGTMQGCGGGSGSGDNVALCQQACDKALSCIPDAGAEAQQAATECKQRCATTVPTTHCSNEAEIVSAARACLQLACDAYLNCSVPACQSTSGTGGSGGNGGTSGGGGSGWTCEEDTQTMSCGCVNGPGGSLTSCPATYNCCLTLSAQGSDTCICSNAETTSACTMAIAALGGTKVNRCPP
jgi:hypothetical protein